MTPARTLDLILPAPGTRPGDMENATSENTGRPPGTAAATARRESRSISATAAVGRSDRAEYVTSHDFRRRDQLRELVERYQVPEGMFEDILEGEAVAYLQQPQSYRDVVPFVGWLHARAVGRVGR